MENFHSPIDIKDNLCDVFLTRLRIIEDQGGYIAGGFARGIINVFSGTHPAKKYNDIDFFLDDHANYPEIFSLFSDWFTYKGSHDYSGVEVDNFLAMDRKIQLVKEPYLPPEHQIDKFDFSVCKAFIQDGKVYMTDSCWADCISLNMTYNKNRMILTEKDTAYLCYRLQQYFEKGFFLTLEEIVKIYHKILDNDCKELFAAYISNDRVQVRDYEKFEVIERLYRL